ncbi:MAG TPA: amidohydrolase family protein [Candidatus Binatia bacterium]|jgi:dihydropyrimidinase/dihydroorotase|nr:amidohydrolase family protein [Candidatus Binatia bacterium]
MVNGTLDMIVKGGQVVTAAGTKNLAIGVKDGKIAVLALDEALTSAREIIDARGKHVFPGLVDPENHLGTQRPLKDSMNSETRAAAAGGVTTWGIMQASPKLRRNYIDEPKLEDVVPFSQVMPEFIEGVESHSFVDMFLTGFITTDEQALDIPRVAHEFGVTSFKFYLHMMQGPRTFSVWSGRQKGGWLGFDDGTIYLAMEKAAEIGPPGLICIHPENYEIVRIFEDRLKKTGRTDMAAWDERSPHFCEAGHVRTYTYYAGITGCPLYIVHTTTKESIDEIRRARAEGVKVYSQTGHHYLTLNHDVWKINVPLRSEQTTAQLWEALIAGHIDCIGTDHVDWGMSREQMDKGNVWETSSGFPSRVEAYLPVMLTEGFHKGRISLEKLVEVCCENPARIFGLYPKKGAVAVGSDADLVIVDVNRTMRVSRNMIHSSAGWSIWEGKELKGWPVMTILRGQAIMEWPEGAPRAKILDEKPSGRYLPRKVGHQLYPV